MKRASKTQNQIRQELLTQRRKEEEALAIHLHIQAAQEAEAAKPRIGPKDPVYLPYKENNMFY